MIDFSKLPRYQNVHYYIFVFCSATLVLGGLYAGLIAPMFSRSSKGFAHGRNENMMLMALFAVLVAIGGVFSASVARTENIQLALTEMPFQFYLIANYWNLSPALCPDQGTFIFVYSLALYSLVFPLFYCALNNWPSPSLKAKEPAPDSHVFLIVAHNSSKTGIDETLRALLKLVKPHQIYVADNGSSKEEEAATDDLCNSMSEEYYLSDPKATVTYIQVGHLSKGNKSFAQYSAVYYLNEEIEKNKLNVKYVTIIDDDVIVPPHWNYRSIEKLFEDQTKVALAYPLCVANADKNIVTVHQDLEYLTGDCDRFGWDQFGNQLFCSGAIATWRVKPFLKILERHCTCFNGEDLEMGYLLHRLSDKETDKLGLDHQARIGFVRDCIVPTAVPFCTIHWFDFLPTDLKKKWKLGCKKCGEHSFVNQRVRSWDCAGHSFFFKYLRVLFTFRGLNYSKKAFIRFICTIKALNLGRDLMAMTGLMFAIYKVIRGANGFFFLAFWFDCSLIAWTSMFIYNNFASFKLRKAEKRFQPEVMFVDPVLLIGQITLVNTLGSLLYSFCYYFWIPFSPPIKKQIKTDKVLAEELHTSWYRSLEAAKQKQTVSSEITAVAIPIALSVGESEDITDIARTNSMVSIIDDDTVVSAPLTRIGTVVSGVDGSTVVGKPASKIPNYITVNEEEPLKPLKTLTNDSDEISKPEKAMVSDTVNPVVSVALPVA